MTVQDKTPGRPDTEVGISRRSGRSGTRERILRSAAEVAGEVGPAHLSLEAVAHRAGVSKGGLLYHFPSKQDLIIAVVEHDLATSDEACRNAERAAAASACPAALGHLEAFDRICRDKPDMPPGILTALAETPAILQPIRDRNKRVAARIRAAGPNWRLGMIAFYMVEGMQALKLFDAEPLDPAAREDVIEAMRSLLLAAAPSPPPAGENCADQPGARQGKPDAVPTDA